MELPIENPKVLVIDDEADIRHLLAMSLVQLNIDVDCAKDVAEAMMHLKNNTYNLCITDMKLPDGNGLSIVEHCHKEIPHMPIAVITAYGNSDISVKAMKLGAFDFLSKPIELVQLRQLLRNGFKYYSEKSQNKDQYPIDYLHGTGEAVSRLKTQLEKAKKTNAPVIVNGSKGTKKEELAKFIHSLSSRSDYKEVYLDCSTLEPEDAEKLLFSTDDKEANILLKAHNSSLIISNIHLLNKFSQKKLLQALENKTLILENEKDTLIDVRVIVCTEIPLEKYVASLHLREDLFFRLDVLQVFAPSIEQRSDDFEELIETYRARLTPDKSIDNKALRKLLSYKFPFNYRELEKVLIKANSSSLSETIELEDLEFNHTDFLQNAEPKQSKNGLSSRGDMSLDEYIESIEIQEIRAALDKTRWNRTEAAKLLGISFRTIRYKIKKLGID